MSTMQDKLVSLAALTKQGVPDQAIARQLKIASSSILAYRSLARKQGLLPPLENEKKPASTKLRKPSAPKTIPVAKQPAAVVAAPETVDERPAPSPAPAVVVNEPSLSEKSTLLCKQVALLRRRELTTREIAIRLGVSVLQVANAAAMARSLGYDHPDFDLSGVSLPPRKDDAAPAPKPEAIMPLAMADVADGDGGTILSRKLVIKNTDGESGLRFEGHRPLPEPAKTIETIVADTLKAGRTEPSPFRIEKPTPQVALPSGASLAPVIEPDAKETDQPFAIGDVVCLPSGGPKLTVVGYADDGDVIAWLAHETGFAGIEIDARALRHV